MEVLAFVAPVVTHTTATMATTTTTTTTTTATGVTGTAGKQRLRSLTAAPTSPLDGAPFVFEGTDLAPLADAFAAALALDFQMIGEEAAVKTEEAAVKTEEAAVKTEEAAPPDLPTAEPAAPIVPEPPALPTAEAVAAEPAALPAAEAVAVEAPAPEPAPVDWKDLVHTSETCALCEYHMNCGFTDPAPEAGECALCKEHSENILFVCYDFGVEHWVKSPCEHRFCGDCLAGWVKAHIEDGKTLIKCPSEGCACAMFPDDVHRVDATLYTKLTFLSTRNFTERLGELKKDADLAAWLDGNTKECPKCHVVIERSEGCNYMVCHCGTQFCYSCGLDYNEDTHDYCS